MLRYFVALIILIHGLIHFMGFSKAFGYGNIQQLTKFISRPVGILWLSAAVLFIISAILFAVKKDSWWMVGIPAVLLSQVLLILAWHDAKYGTVINIILLIICIVSYAAWDFNRMVKKEVAALLEQPFKQTGFVSNEMISKLPPVVQKWMQHAGVVGKPIIQTVRLKQHGMMLTKPGGKWMDFTANQYFSTGKPAFNWQVKVNVMPLIYLTGRDKYENGKGEMLIRLLFLKTIVDSKGSPEIDQGTLLRYLSEMSWFPSAALSDYITWEAIDDHAAKATMSYNNITASGIFFFNERSDVIGFEAMRYGEFNGKASLEKWHIESKDFKDFDGIRIPGKSEVTWKLKDGDFTWLKVELLTVEFNKSEPF